MLTKTVASKLGRTRSVARQSCRTFTSAPSLLQPQKALPAAFYRGGTSKAVMFKEQDLPSDKAAWPSIFRAVLGSPDPNGRQLNGMGGGVSSVSKVCVVGPSKRDNADVDYTFAAIGIKDEEVDFSSNCGNMTSAIGPFAVDQGIVQKPDGDAVVRIHNTNTGKLIDASFPVENAEAVSEGDLAIDGVAGTAARIQLSFLNPSGSKTGKLLPTGQVSDVFDGVDATCIDVGNPCVFVSADQLEAEGTMLADAIENDSRLLTKLDSMRRQAAEAMGIKASGSIPKIAMVSKSKPHKVQSGRHLDDKSCDLVVRALSVGQPHRAVPITVAMALAAASKLEGSVVQKNTAINPADKDGVTIGHNSGTILVNAEMDGRTGVEHATVFRTARRLMDGRVYYKATS